MLPGGALLRFTLPAGAWAEDVPPVPAGAAATVAFSSDHAEGEHGDALRLLGYEVVGIVPPDDAPASATGDGGADRPDRPDQDDRDDPDSAELVVARDVLERHPTWFRSLLVQSAKAYDLSMGPVLGLLQHRLEPHVLARRGRGG